MSQKNNFDLMRLILALVVCVVHVSTLSGFSQFAHYGDFFSSYVAVNAFFVISGYLIFMSYERSTSLRAYFSKRVRRIYPAYFVVVFLCALGCIAVTASEIDHDFLKSWVQYLLANLSFLNFLHPTLPGVFATNLDHTVNSALWSLKIEAMFYLVVPLLVLALHRFHRLGVLAILYGCSLAYTALLTRIAEHTGSALVTELARQLPGQLCYFVSGAFFFYYQPFFERHTVAFLIPAVLILAVNNVFALPLFEPFALATVVLFFALFRYLGNVTKHGDFSYSIYILHCPILQVLLSYSLFAQHPYWLLAATLCTTALASAAMWHLVEKRFLLRGSHYLRA